MTSVEFASNVIAASGFAVILMVKVFFSVEAVTTPSVPVVYVAVTSNEAVPAFVGVPLTIPLSNDSP